jgi:hypothetical protein
MLKNRRQASGLLAERDWIAVGISNRRDPLAHLL